VYFALIFWPPAHCVVIDLRDFDEMLHQTLIEVLTTQVSITVSRQHLEDALVDGQNRHIEGSTTQIVDWTRETHKQGSEECE
jgi:hypothetical protein